MCAIIQFLIVLVQSLKLAKDFGLGKVFLIKLLLKRLTYKIFAFIILVFPVVIFSIVGVNGENLIYFLTYMLKYLIKQKVYLYDK